MISLRMTCPGIVSGVNHLTSCSYGVFGGCGILRFVLELCVVSSDLRFLSEFCELDELHGVIDSSTWTKWLTTHYRSPRL